MMTFNYNSKTGRFDYHLTGHISQNNIKVLKAIAANQVGSHEVLEAAFADVPDNHDGRNDRYQLVSNSTHHLLDLGLIEWKNDQTVTIEVNHKDYSKNKSEKKSGYFLTYSGKAFVRSLGVKPFSPYDVK